MRRHLIAIAVSVLVFAADGIRARQAPLAPHQQLAHDIYKELIEINTTDSTGTTVAAQAMAKRFRDAGFPDADIFIGGPRDDKHNIVVRYHGKGGASCAEAAAAPRAPRRRRGAQDRLVARSRSVHVHRARRLLLRARHRRRQGDGVDLRRQPDSLEARRTSSRRATSSSRSRPTKRAADRTASRWLVTNHRELVDAAYVVNEGGGGSLRDGKPFFNSVQATEKIVANFTLTAKNRGGHSSEPRPDNAIYQLAAGLVRLGQFNFPVQLNDVTRAFFTKTAAIETPETGLPRCAPSSRIRTTPGDRGVARARSALQLDAPHDLRRDDAHRRTRDERAAADRAGDRQLPHAAERRSGDGARRASFARSPIRRSTCPPRRR